ncbi:MAG: transcription elongation factor GreA, partial [Alphaproteobacteria bacterium]|nr:transcription elongation factor GreA [Alphaproteobacteria bacterium]
MEKVPMTQTGFTRMEEELKRLKTEERPAIIRALEEARAHGDLSENAEYHAAKERQAFVESRVAELESKISRAQIIDTAALTGKTVKFGATVTVVDEDDDAKMKFQIVGEDEADIKA